MRLLIAMLFLLAAASPAGAEDGKLNVNPHWSETKDKCKECHGRIPQKGGKRLETDFDFCKGCGICSKECPFQAIVMEKEKK